jgi:hypothetical protein
MQPFLVRKPGGKFGVSQDEVVGHALRAFDGISAGIGFAFGEPGQTGQSRWMDLLSPTERR